MNGHTITNAMVRSLMWPLDALLSAVELHRLQRQMPNAHRRLIWEAGEARQESDAEFLDRLREMADERFDD